MPYFSFPSKCTKGWQELICMCSHFSVSGSECQGKLDRINKHTNGFFLHDFVLLALLKIKLFEESEIYL